MNSVSLIFHYFNLSIQQLIDYCYFYCWWYEMLRCHFQLLLFIILFLK